MSSNYGKDRDREKVEATLARLENLAETHDQPQQRVFLAGGLIDASFLSGLAGDYDMMEAYLARLEAVAETHDESELWECLSRALYQASLIYEKDRRPERMEATLERLRTSIGKTTNAARKT
ncbi:MAG: hypothetical protein PHW58_06870, partial [Candidatus Methanofastidiosa archaeon]|nr:hypothetical protein [Candidatus Methanofastidiosa archaeon]